MGLQIWNLADIANWQRVCHQTNFAGYDGDFSPDGSLFALPTDDRLVLLDVGQTLGGDLQFGAIARNVRTARFSPAGTTLVTAGWGTNAVLWRVADGAKLGAFTNHMQHVHAAVFSPDGRAVAFSPDDGLVAAVGSDGTDILLWDVESGARRPRLPGLSPRMDTLLSAEDAMREDIAEAPPPRVNDLAWSSNGMLAVAYVLKSSSGNGGVRRHRIGFWDVNRGVITNPL